MLDQENTTLPGTEQGTTATSDIELRAAALVKDNPLIVKAAKVVVDHQKASTSFVQRQLSIGYNKAAKLVEILEDLGMVTSADHVGKREVVATEVPEELKRAGDIARVKGSAIPMKETAEDQEVANAAYRVHADELRQFIERFERLEQEKKDVADHQKEVMAEAKGRGYDVKVMRKIIALRKRDQNDIAEEEAVLEMYKEALGMS